METSPSTTHTPKSSKTTSISHQAIESVESNPSTSDEASSTTLSTPTSTSIDPVVPNKPTTGTAPPRTATRTRSSSIFRKRNKGAESKYDTVKIGKAVRDGDPNYHIVHGMLLGIRLSVGRQANLSESVLQWKHFFEQIKLYMPKTGSSNTTAHGGQYNFKFKDYAPVVFHKLRGMFGIDESDYLISLTNDYLLSELITPGKSGSMFYFSHDGRYVIKTITPSESLFIRHILPEYYQHILHNPSTFLTRFFALHRYKTYKGKKIHFIVMGNVFSPDKEPNEQFDLKGSLIGRRLKQSELKKLPEGTLPTYKDLDFMDKKMMVYLGPTKKQIFLDQLKRDAQFLASLKIMDYSILIGIHYPHKATKAPRDRSVSIFMTPDESTKHATHGLRVDELKYDESANKPRKRKIRIKAAATAASINPRKSKTSQSMFQLRSKSSDIGTSDSKADSTVASTASLSPVDTQLVTSVSATPLTTSNTSFQNTASNAGTPSDSSANDQNLSLSPPGMTATSTSTSTTIDPISKNSTSTSSTTTTSTTSSTTSLSRLDSTNSITLPAPGGRSRKKKIDSTLKFDTRKYVPSVFLKDSNGFRASDSKDRDRPEVYYMGIIDILQKYNKRKRTEHSLKSLLHDGKKISAVNPKHYSTRFYDFIAQNTGSTKESDLQNEKYTRSSETSSSDDDTSDMNSSDEDPEDIENNDVNSISMTIG